MPTESGPAESDRPRANSLRADESGAILVMGIFMCTGVVGMLWYVAGIGDAIQYRERLQESSDAVAFSSAVLHARGMNLIVLLNLLMAVILSIRVTLKVLTLALVIVGTILVAAIFTAGAGAALLTAAKYTADFEKASRPVIDQTLRALSKVQVGVKWVVPPAAVVGSYQVGERYKPVCSGSLALGVKALSNGLPVDEGTTSKLCGKAGAAMATLLTSIMPGMPGRGKVIDYTEKIVAKGEAYFCALGGGASAPDLSSEFESGADTACDDEIDDLRRDRNEKRGRYQSACASYNAPCRGGIGPFNENLTDAEQADLDQKLAEYDAAERAVNRWDRDDCMDQQLGKMQDALNETGATDAVSSNGDGMTPKMVSPGWKNGINDAQILALATGNTDTLNIAPKGLNVSSWNNVQIRTPETASFALAQAEFFYDCPGSWTSNACNSSNTEEGEAMWNMAWRARLRRYNRPFSDLEAFAEALAGAEAFSRAVDAVDPSSLTWGSAQMLGELIDTVSDGELFIH